MKTDTLATLDRMGLEFAKLNQSLQNSYQWTDVPDPLRQEAIKTTEQLQQWVCELRNQLPHE